MRAWKRTKTHSVAGGAELFPRVVDLWHAKAHVIALVAHFVLCMRNLLSLKQPLNDELEAVLLDRVGHIQEIRVKIGGVAGG
jgi:hypothetical protein